MKPFEDTMAELAEDIRKKCADVDLHEKVEAFKALTPYYVALRRYGPKGAAEKTETGTFANFQEDLDDANEETRQ